MGAAVVLAVAFVLHVPVLKYFTAPAKSSGYFSYANLNDGVEGDAYSIEKILHGWVLEVFYDAQKEQYLILTEFVEKDPDNYSDRHLITLDRQGQHLETVGISQDDLEKLLDNPALQPVPLDNERRYVPEYSFDQSPGTIDLEHYTFQEFSQWPGFYYYFPVVYSDWTGTAYLKITHDTEVFKVQIPTDYYGGFLYTAGSVDGQVYFRTRPGETSGLAFLEVGESSYTSDMDGNETHREGYGLYVIRRK